MHLPYMPQGADSGLAGCYSHQGTLLVAVETSEIGNTLVGVRSQLDLWLVLDEHGASVTKCVP